MFLPWVQSVVFLSDTGWVRSLIFPSDTGMYTMFGPPLVHMKQYTK